MQVSLYRPLSLDTSNHDISHIAWHNISGRIQRPWTMLIPVKLRWVFGRLFILSPFLFSGQFPSWLIFFKWHGAPLLTLPQNEKHISHQTHGEVGWGKSSSSQEGCPLKVGDMWSFQAFSPGTDRGFEPQKIRDPETKVWRIPEDFCWEKSKSIFFWRLAVAVFWKFEDVDWTCRDDVTWNTVSKRWQVQFGVDFSWDFRDAQMLLV